MPEPAGIFFTDSAGTVHDLEREPALRPKQVAADPRMGGISATAVRRLVNRGLLYPVIRSNARVLLILDCALTDWQARQIAANRPRPAPVQAPMGMESRRPIPKRMLLTPAAGAASVGTVGACARRV